MSKEKIHILFASGIFPPAIGGHTAKHLLAAGGLLCIAIYLTRRTIHDPGSK